jgi:hypothetical protein
MAASRPHRPGAGRCRSPHDSVLLRVATCRDLQCRGPGPQHGPPEPVSQEAFATTLLTIAEVLVGAARVTPGGRVDADTVAGVVETLLWGEPVHAPIAASAPTPEASLLVGQ